MKITAEHIKLLKEMNFDWDDECEFGAISTDPKRPFGNSDVAGDVEEHLGLPQESLEWKDAKKYVIPLAAIVEHIMHTTDLDALVGTEVLMPWRAERYLKALK